MSISGKQKTRVKRAKRGAVKASLFPLQVPCFAHMQQSSHYIQKKNDVNPDTYFFIIA
jgi:hypothetical protein